MKVELYDYVNCPHRIETLNPPLLREWLAEWLPRLWPVNADYLGPVRISIWPSFGPDGQPDWVCDSRVLNEPPYPLPSADPDEAMNFIAGLRTRLEAKIADLESRRAADR